MMQTYQDLLDKLKQLTPEQLRTTVTVENGINGEFYQAYLDTTNSYSDVLDENHPVIYFD